MSKQREELIQMETTIKSIKKRNGKIVDFEPIKITDAILKAAQSVGIDDREAAENITPTIVRKLEAKFSDRTPLVEEIQDIVEETLMEAEHAQTAKAYILYRQKRSEERAKRALILGEGKADANLNFTNNALQVLARRYLLKDDVGKVIETPQEMVERISRNISQADKMYGATEEEIKKTEKEFYDLLADLKFLPNTPTIMNAGTKMQQLSGCFVLPVEDSMEGIFTTLKDSALVHKSGGGTGFSFSRLRPKKDLVKTTAGVASGPVTFMTVFDKATEVIKQGGKRRGANMSILRIDHPDILDFIEAKADMKTLTNFNISVAITDKFMEAVENDATYDLIHPKTKNVVDTYKARDVFSLIVQNAWKNGDPGVIFIDEINRKHPAKHLGEIESTNPCVTGDTFITTGFGLISIDDAVEKFSNGGLPIMTDGRVPVEIACGDNILLAEQETTFRQASKIIYSGLKETFKLKTNSGYTVTATPDHKIFTTSGWKKFEELVPGKDEICIQNYEGVFNLDSSLPFSVKKEYAGEKGGRYGKNYPDTWSYELGTAMGLLVGDGWLREGDNCRVGFTFSKEDLDILDYIKPIINDWYGNSIQEIQRENGVYHLSYHSQNFVDFFIKLGISSKKAEEKVVPKSIFTAPKKAVVGFLRGLFSADGTIGLHEKNNTSYIRLSSKSEQLLKETQLLLLNLGIKSKIYDRHRDVREGFPYTTKDGDKRTYVLDGKLYELHISKDMIPKFLDKVGFLNKKHSAKIETLRKKSFYRTHFVEKIQSIVPTGTQKVYDIVEPVTHSFIGGGFILHNCGEQPLLPYESCNLGSINLHKFVNEEGTDLDWDMLREAVQTAVHFLDNVIDMNKYPIPEIEEVTRQTRKIGLGIMGYADMLYNIGVRYDSEEGLAMAEKVMSFINNEAYAASQQLAEERGVCPAWKGSDHEKEGRKMRNMCCTTIAPTGTISMMAECSGGCEPNFAISYIKNVMDGTELIYTNKAFEEVAKKRGFYTLELMRTIANTGTLRGIEGVPEDVKSTFVTAQDIAPEWHVKIQAAFQRHVDSSISKTINFPHTATIQDVETAYIQAWKSKCKGITTYRDGSRDNQVLNIGEVKGKISDSPTAVEHAIQEMKEESRVSQKNECPECKGPLIMMEGCATCSSCGFGLCST